jgi:heat shock protein HtpX
MRTVYMLLAFLLLVAFYLSLIAIIIGLGYLAIVVAMRGRIKAAFALGFVDFILIVGLFAKARPPLGLRKEEHDLPALFQMVREVAAKTGTAPADEVYVSPDANIGVRETGGFLGLPIGTKRVLLVGVAALQAVTMDQFRAILAHEMAHYQKGDTTVGRFLARVPLSVVTMLGGMRARTAWWFINPVYWYLFLFAHGYMIVISAMSRRQEFTADEIAAETYGSDVFGSALTNLVVDSTLFGAIIMPGAQKLMTEGQVLINAYATHREVREKMPGEDRERVLQELMAEKRGAFSSHPTLSERLEALKRYPTAREGTRDERPAREIFTDPEATEKELTEFLSAIIYHAQHRGEAAESAEPAEAGD